MHREESEAGARADGRPEGEDVPLGRDVVRELDRRAIQDFGLPALLLMENAGRACADEALAMLPGAGRAGEVVVLCGPGNNGGDGLVVARTLHNRGVSVRVGFVGELERLERCSEDVRTNARLWRALGGAIHEIASLADLAGLEARLANAALVVDALFGTGLTRPLRDPWAAAVRAMDAAPAAVLAVDLPSGLDADTGEVLGACARAAATVTFVAPKPGLVRGEGPRLAGRVRVAEIGIPRELLEAARRAAPRVSS